MRVCTTGQEPTLAPVSLVSMCIPTLEKQPSSYTVRIEAGIKYRQFQQSTNMYLAELLIRIQEKLDANPGKNLKRMRIHALNELWRAER
jgi:hypothetical protein